MTARSGSQKREPLPFCVLVGVLALSASHPLSSSPKGGAKALTKEYKNVLSIVAILR